MLESILTILISTILVNNYIFAQFLGICPFLGVSSKTETALGMGVAVTFVVVLASAITWLIQNFVLNKFGLEYLQTIAFILVIASLVQFVEMFIKKSSPSLYQAMGVSLGFTLALVLIAALREKLMLADVPKALQGVPIALVSAGLMAIAFSGFGGLV